jgi:RNA polymerase sigma-70 factor (ECF subfamily)
MDPVEQARQQALVARCQIGDRRALEELFLRHNGPLGYYLRRMLSRDEVGDVQQEVWLTVIRRIGRLRAPGAFVVWLYQIARREAVDRLAGRDASVPLAGDEPGSSAGPNGSPGAADAEFSPEDAAAIHVRLSQLSPEHREVLLLRFMEDLSYEQIAGVTGCSPGTVRSRLHYGKLALRKLLEDTR